MNIKIVPGDIMRLSVYTRGVEISRDEADSMWITESRSTIIEDKVYDNSGVSMVVAVLMMQAQKMKYGCQSLTDGSRFWIELRSAEERIRFEKDEER